MLPSVAVQKATRDLTRFQREWQGETPIRLHRRMPAADGTPDFTSEFIDWLNRERLSDDALATDSKLRFTRAMRTLRKIAPREYDVMHRVLAGHTTEAIRDWLNDRAVRGGHPERYSLKDTVVLIVSGADKLAAWY